MKITHHPILLTLLGLSLLATPMLQSCGDSDDAPQVSTGTLTLSADTLTVGREQSEHTISVNASRGEWTAYVEGAKWLTIQTRGTASSQGTITLRIGANQLGAERRAEVTVKSGTTYKTLTVVQTADDEDDNEQEVTEIKTPDGYTLVWNDEFNEGSELNADDWVHEEWRAGYVNNELQTYTNRAIDGRRTTELKNGFLNINLFKASDGKIYSGRVNARPTRGWTYGYFEARIKLPKGKGTWPAFWMMPVSFDGQSNPWPGCGEIDIMEEVGVDANYVVSTIHCNRYNNGGTGTESGKRYIATAESDYHVYALEWTADFMKFYADGELVLNYENAHSGRDQWPFDYAFYPILNLAWGGDWGGYAGVDNNALPVTMKVDYVRIFQKQ